MPDTPPRLTIAGGDAATSVAGEIDAHTAPQLAAYFATLPVGDADIVIDMSEVEFIDSSGLRVLIDVHQRAEHESRRLILLAPSHSVTRIVEIAGLDDHLHLAP